MMNIVKITFRLIFILVLFVPAYALSQADLNKDFTYSIQHWSKEDGLPSWNILSYFQDKKGQLWMGTNESLMSFDGYEFKVHYKTSKSECTIERIEEDNEGNIWFIERYNVKSELLCYSPITGETRKINELPAFNKDDFYRVLIKENQFLIFNEKGDFFDKNGNIQFSLPFHSNELHFCFLTPEQNIWVVEAKSHPVDKDEYPDDLAPDYRIYLYQKDGTLIYSDTLLSNNDMAYLFWEEKGSLYTILQPVPLGKGFSSLSSIEFTSKGRNPFSLSQSTFNIQNRRYRHTGWTVFFTPVLFQKNLLIRRVNESVKFYHEGKALSLEGTPLDILDDEKNTINYYFIDNTGAFWLNNASGLFKVEIKKNKFQQYLSEHSLYYSTRDMLIDHKGKLQVHAYKGTQEVNLSTGETETKPFEHEDSRNGTIKSGLMLYEEGEDLWVGQHGAIATYLFNDDGLIAYPFHPKSTRRIYDMLRVDKELWLGTSEGIFRIDKKNQQTVGLYQKDININFLHENEKGIWATTNKGVYLFDRKGKLKQKFLQDFFNEKSYIKHLYEDEDGTFWLATTDGLVHWNPTEDEVLLHLTTDDGLSDNSIHAIYDDKLGFLWMPSNYGLMRFHKASKKIKTYMEKDGIAHYEFNHSSHYQAKDGRLFFGGISGITAFYPEEILEESNSNSLYPFIVDGEIINGKSGKITSLSNDINRERKIKLSPSQNFITINLTAFLLEKNPDVEYNWQLGNQNIVIQKDRTIRLSNLGYGHQRLHIKVREVGQNWSDHTLTIEIDRIKPFYLQWWFWSIIIALIGYTIWQYFKSRTLKLEKDKEQLSNLVKERTAKIEQDKQIIEEQAERLTMLNQSQKQFFTNITHEFRTPLTLVIGPLLQLREEKFSKKIKEQHWMMLKNAQHLQTLINQLLDLSKLESGQMQLEIAQGDLSAYTKDLVSRFQPLAEEKKQLLHFYSTITPFETHFDKEKWSKIIYNLISNAIKFTPVGGNIQVDLIKIEPKDASETGQVHLLVQDTGIGIPQESMSNVFNRFYQIDGSTKRTQEGSGIGLSLIKELIELQKGEIVVHSKVGKGTSFEVKLPLMSQPSTTDNSYKEDVVPDIFIPFERTSPMPINERNVLENKTFEILIIEDNADMRQYIQSCLEPFNYHIRIAVNGEDGCEQALETIPDLIISDVMMPKKDGFEVVTTIRKNAATSHIPIILLTAKSSLASRLEGLERGSDAYLTKPFSPEELLLRIRKLIELRQLIQTRYQKGADLLVSQSAPMLKKEDEFMQKFQEIILSNLTNEALSSEWLAQQHLMSRTNFYKKVKALTGHTVGKFINIIRLQEAEKLMNMGENNMTSISYQVGFSSPSQFSKVCKRILGKSPSEYMESLKS